MSNGTVALYPKKIITPKKIQLPKKRSLNSPSCARPCRKNRLILLSVFLFLLIFDWKKNLDFFIFLDFFDRLETRRGTEPPPLSPLALNQKRTVPRGAPHEGESPVKFLSESVESLKKIAKNQK